VALYAKELVTGLWRFLRSSISPKGEVDRETSWRLRVTSLRLYSLLLSSISTGGAELYVGCQSGRRSDAELLVMFVPFEPSADIM